MIGSSVRLPILGWVEAEVDPVLSDPGDQRIRSRRPYISTTFQVSDKTAFDEHRPSFNVLHVYMLHM
jgi:hypothetical protein